MDHGDQPGRLDARCAAVRAALAACPFVVVSDCIAETDTSAFAHVKLPALGWGEKDGTVTNSRARDLAASAGFSLRPARREPTGGSWREVARRMGWADAFDYAHQRRASSANSRR